MSRRRMSPWLWQPKELRMKASAWATLCARRWEPIAMVCQLTGVVEG